MATPAQKAAIREFAKAAFEEQQPPEPPPVVSPWERFFPGETITPVPIADVNRFDPFLLKGQECIYLGVFKGAEWYLAPGPGEPILIGREPR